MPPGLKEIVMKMLSHRDAIKLRFKADLFDFSSSVTFLQQVSVDENGVVSKALKFVTKKPMQDFEGIKAIDLCLDNQLSLGKLPDEACFIPRSDFLVIDSLNKY